MSGLFGSSNKQPQPRQKPMGAEEHRVSTAEQARPVPYLVGKQRLAGTFITDVFDEQAVAKTQTIGKQKSKVGYNYFASFATLVCLGPVDALYDIFLNGDSVYASTTVIKIQSLTSTAGTATATTNNAHGLTTGDEVLIEGAQQIEYNGTQTITVTDSKHFTFPVSGTPVTPATGTITARLKLDPVFRADNPDYVDVVIPDYGTMRLYWGTEVQEPDAYLQTSGTAHPAYRGLCYAVFDQLFLGFNQTNVQNVEFTVSRRPVPVSEWHDLADINEDANPIAFLADMLQNPRGGLSLEDARINTAAFVATGEAIEAEGIGFSPIITRQQEARQVLLAALEYFNGYPTLNDDHQLSIALARKQTGDVVEIIADDMVSRPQFTEEDWSAAFTTTYVKFTNRDLDFKEDAPPPYRDHGLLSIVNEPNIQVLDRAWITRAEVATAVGNSTGRAAAIPRLKGNVKLRITGTLFTDLAPGALFRLNYPSRSLTGLWFRVLDRTLGHPAKPEFDINFEMERSHVFQTVA